MNNTPNIMPETDTTTQVQSAEERSTETVQQQRCENCKCDNCECENCDCGNTATASETSQQSVQQSRQVSFDNIVLNSDVFNDNYIVLVGSATQVILGMRYMAEKTGDGENEYQRHLYPKLRELANDIDTRYVTDLLSSDEGVQRQVFGANLNGPRNNGSLNRLVVVRNIRRSLRYKYAQFGELLRVLQNRLHFILRRDPMSVPRYHDNADERHEYNVLRDRVKNFLDYLETVRDEWAQTVAGAREVSGETRQSDRSENSQASRTQRLGSGPRQQRDTRNQYSYQQRTPRNRYNSRHQETDNEWQTVPTRRGNYNRQQNYQPRSHDQQYHNVHDDERRQYGHREHPYRDEQSGGRRQQGRPYKRSSPANGRRFERSERPEQRQRQYDSQTATENAGTRQYGRRFGQR